MSKSNQLTEQLSKCVNNVLLKYSLPSTGDIMRKFPQVLDSICANEYIVKSLKQKSGPAMVNAILGLFGLEAIHKGEVVTIDEEAFKRFIEIDSMDATDRLETIARELQDFERDVDAQKNKLVGQIQKQAGDMEYVKRDYNNLQRQYDTEKNSYLVSMERLLEAIGPSPDKEELIVLKQIVESSLEQLGISIVWDMPSDDDGKMFFVQKTGIKQERTVQRPCLMDNEKVVLKGLAYQVVEE